MFEECFVFQGIVSNESVSSILYLPSTEDKDSQRVFQMLQTFIKNCKPSSLDNFLRFVTGTSSSATCILLRRIQVSCDTTNSIHVGHARAQKRRNKFLWRPYWTLGKFWRLVTKFTISGFVIFRLFVEQSCTIGSEYDWGDVKRLCTRFLSIPNMAVFVV